MARGFDLVSVQCPSCGADLPPSRPCGSYVCAYCGSRFEVAHVRSAKTAHGVSIDVHRLARELEPAARSVAGVAVAIAAVMGLLVIGGIAVAVFAVTRPSTTTIEVTTNPPGVEGGSLVMRSPPTSPKPDEAPAVTRSEPEPEPEPPPPPLQLSTPFGGAPAFLASVDPPLMIVRMRRRGPEDDLLVEAYRITDGERAWRFEAGASYSEGHQIVRYAIAEGRVLVSDHRAKVHVFDGNSGETLATASLGDHFDRFCRTEEALFVVPKDRKAWRFDTGTDQLVSHGEVPRDCGLRDRESLMADHLFERDARLRRPDRRRIEGDDTEWTRAFEHGDDTLLFGHRSPGTRVTRVGRIEAGAERLAWVADVPEGSMLNVGDDLSRAVSDGARVYVAHPRADRSWVLTAIDGNRGARVWSREIPIDGSVINLEGLAVLGATVVLSSRREINGYDAATGAERWSLGER